MHVGQRLRELTLAAVALVAEPRILGAPEDLHRLPDVRPAETEAEAIGQESRLSYEQSHLAMQASKKRLPLPGSD